MGPNNYSTPTTPSSTAPILRFIWVGLILVILVFAIFFFQRLGGIPKNVSPNILTITQSVYTISGKITSVNGNKISVNANFMTTPASQLSITQAKVPPPSPSYQTINYTVDITSSTEITANSSAPGNLNQPRKLSISDLKAGVGVTVTSKKDLRTLGNEFEAAAIVPDFVYSISGSIISTSPDSITINDFTPPDNGLTNKSYTVSIDSETKILESSFAPGSNGIPSEQQKLLTLNDLQKGKQVSVITKEDVSSSESLTALSIFVVSSPLLPVSSGTSIPQSAQSTKPSKTSSP